MVDPQRVFDQFKPSATGTDRIKLGPGVVGNTSTTLAIAFAACVGLAWALAAHPIYALTAVLLVICVVVVFIFGTWRFADRHPDLALLGGSELLRLRELQMAGKNHPIIPVMPPVEAPPDPVILAVGEPNGR